MIAYLLLLILVFHGVVMAEVDERDPNWFMKLPTAPQSATTTLFLYSWAPQQGPRRFALIEDKDGKQQDIFLDNFDMRDTPGVDLRELENRLRKLPKGHVIAWMADETRHLDHADEKLVRKLRKFAEEVGLDIRLNYHFYHAP